MYTMFESRWTVQWWKDTCIIACV